LSSKRRWPVQAFKAVLPAFALALLMPLAAAAAPAPSFWFAGSNVVFSKSQMHGGELAVGLDDSGLTRFLIKLNATVAYDPNQRLVIITAGDRRTITFAIGDARFENGSVHGRAPFAPYVVGTTAYLPFVTLAKALYVVPVPDGATTVLQPQIGGLDVHTRDRVTTVTLAAAVPLHFKRTSAASNERLTLMFAGVASTLETNRKIGGSAELRGLTMTSGGSARNPNTTVTFDATPQTLHALANGDAPNVLALAFAKSGVALGGVQVPDSGDATTVVAAAPRRRPSAVNAGDECAERGADGRVRHRRQRGSG